MNITVLFFGITTDLVGKTTITYSIKNSTSVENLKELLKVEFPNLKNIDDFAVAVNEEYATNEILLKNGDVVAIIPPVSGG